MISFGINVYVIPRDTQRILRETYLDEFHECILVSIPGVGYGFIDEDIAIFDAESLNRLIVFHIE